VSPSTPWPEDQKGWEKRYEEESNLPLQEEKSKDEEKDQDGDKTEK
jgi:hypothetical protein